MQQDNPSRRGGFFPRSVQFPARLYAILELHDAMPGAAVSWLPHGRAFIIHDQREFLEVAAPLFFRQTKIRSFYRQLNLWGFKRVSGGVDEGAWYNEFFLRGAPREMEKMVRVKIKNNGNKGGGPGGGEAPDFYSMPPLPRVVNDRSARTLVPGRRVTLDFLPPEGEVATASSGLSRRLSWHNCTMLKARWDGPKPPPLDASDSATVSTENTSESGKSTETGTGPDLPPGVPSLSSQFPVDDKGKDWLTARLAASLPPSVSSPNPMGPLQNETRSKLAATDPFPVNEKGKDWLTSRLAASLPPSVSSPNPMAPLQNETRSKLTATDPFPVDAKGKDWLTTRLAASLPPSVSSPNPMAPLKNETKSQSAANDPYPVDDKGKDWLTARLAASLPPSVSSPNLMSLQNETKSQLAATDELEPLPVGDDDAPVDDFSNYIANTIQILEFPSKVEGTL